MQQPNHSIDRNEIYFHHLDLRDILSKIELLFEIQFEEEFDPIDMTVQEIAVLVISKLNKKPTEECTATSFFFRFRQLLINQYGFTKDTIKPSTNLAVVFPIKKRKQRIKEIEQALGVQTNIVGAQAGPILFLILCIIVSFVVLFFTFHVGLALLVLSIAVLKAIIYFGNSLYVSTIKEYIQRVIKAKYFQARKDPATFNPDEVIRLIGDTFLEEAATEFEDQNILNCRIKVG